MSIRRWQQLLPGLWAGWLMCVALLATPAPFATLAGSDAGRVAARMLLQEAYTSVALAVVPLVLERLAARRRQAVVGFTVSTGLVLGALFCTIAGYFAVQPLMEAARAGQVGLLTFGQLHAVSAAFFVLKTALVLALAWRCVRPATGATLPLSS